MLCPVWFLWFSHKSLLFFAMLNGILYLKEKGIPSHQGSVHRFIFCRFPPPVTLCYQQSSIQIYHGLLLAGHMVAFFSYWWSIGHISKFWRWNLTISETNSVIFDFISPIWSKEVSTYGSKEYELLSSLHRIGPSMMPGEQGPNKEILNKLCWSKGLEEMGRVWTCQHIWNAGGARSALKLWKEAKGSSSKNRELCHYSAQWIMRTVAWRLRQVLLLLEPKHNRQWILGLFLVRKRGKSHG